VSFLHPWMLLGLGAAAIPIILHLIARRRPPTVIFPAVRYLVDTAREHQRRLRIRNLLLLLVRTALIVALMLAASGPSVPISGVPGHAPSALVVIVDNSVSSGAVAGGTAVGEPLRRAAAEVLSRATPEDALWLLTADGLARSGDRKTLTRVVDSLATSSMRLDLGAAIRQADAILAGEERPGEIFLITDLQRTAVSPAATQAPLVVVRPEGDVVSNVGVGSVATGTQPWQFDGGRLIVTIAGDADGPVALSVAVGGRPERQALAGPGAPVAVTVTGLTPGWWPVVVSVDPDELRADDRRVTAVRVAPVARVARHRTRTTAWPRVGSSSRRSPWIPARCTPASSTPAAVRWWSSPGSRARRTAVERSCAWTTRLSTRCRARRWHASSRNAGHDSATMASARCACSVCTGVASSRWGSPRW